MMSDSMLSDEQMNIVLGAGISSWADCTLPTGRHTLPDWCLGAHIDWGNGHCGAPRLILKVRGQIHTWPGQRWIKEGRKMYIARHDDGRALAYYHDGSISREKLLDRRRPDGGYFQMVADCKTVEVMATTKQDGFGGAESWLTMEDGSDLVLRGPWHGGTPAGYVEVTLCDVTSRLYSGKWDLARPWYLKYSGGFLYIKEELFLRIVAKHCAHAKVALVGHSYGARLEAYRAEWAMPKAAIYDVEINRNRAKQPAGPNWRVYWDGTHAYCGSLRVPTYGYRDDVHEGDRATQKEIDAAQAMRARRGF